MQWEARRHRCEPIVNSTNKNNPPSPLNPKSALNQLEDWKELTGFVAMSVASVLGAFLSNGVVRPVSWGIAVISVAAAAWCTRVAFLRRERRAEQERLWNERKDQLRAAFRKLAPFDEQDDLPGQDRKQQARSIATRIISDDFHFGIICGDSGAGKTSLIRSGVVRQIRASGMDCVYLRNPWRLTKSSPATDHSLELLEGELQSFAQQWATGPRVIILDQFEEWLIKHREKEARLLIGKMIAQLTRGDVPVRVVCVVRREFLVDFHDLSATLSDPTNPNNTFRVRNFSVTQGVDVVMECARHDGIPVERSFAVDIANDLADDGEVRPPELQIVCTSLAEAGKLSMAGYQASGGTAAILAHYIKDALDSCRVPKMGAQLLRALCDFPTGTKRPPRTLLELKAAIDPAPVTAGERTGTLVADLTRTFVLARLLTVEKRRSETDVFSLMHDYLVGAVELATSDVSTQTEEANQFLSYYLAQKDERIPLRRLRFIRAHADSQRLNQLNVKRLLRRSLIAPLVYSAAVVCSALALGFGLYAWLTATVHWTSQVVARHWTSDESGGVYYSLTMHGEVVGAEYDVQNHVRIWDPKSAVAIASVDNPDSTFFGLSASRNGAYAMLYRRSADEVAGLRLVRVRDGAVTKLPSGEFLSFSESEQNVGYLVHGTRKSPDDRTHFDTAYLWSIRQNKILRQVTIIPSVIRQSTLKAQFSPDGDRLIAIATEGDRNVLRLYDTISGKELSTLTDPDDDSRHFTVSGLTKKIATVSLGEGPGLLLQLWDLDTGKFLRQTSLPEQISPSRSPIFSPDGQHLVLEGSVSDSVWVFDVSDLVPVHEQPGLHLVYPTVHGSPVVYWPDDNDVQLWKLGRPSITLRNARLSAADRLTSSRDLQRAVIWGSHRPAELWDLTTGRLIKQLRPAGHQWAHFSINDTAVEILDEGSVGSFFAAQDGAALAQQTSADTLGMFYYDPTLRRIHVWNDVGQVVRYVEGRNYLGKFVATVPGATRFPAPTSFAW